MQFGGQLRQMRLQRGLDVPDFAEMLGISPQLLENWENDRTLPDIYVLPRIASALGVSIDELYGFSDDEFMQRVSAAVSGSVPMEDYTFRRNADFLSQRRARDPLNTSVRIMLAQQYSHRARADMQAAAGYAREVLEINPDDPAAWSALTNAMGGRHGDEWLDENTELTDYLRDFLAARPGNFRALQLLVENLLAGGHIDEAAGYINDFALFPGSEYLVCIYSGDVALLRGDRRKALQEWESTVKLYPFTWRAHAAFALRLRRLGLDNRALKEYDRAYEVQSAPRRVEPLISRARLMEKMGLRENAVEERRRIIRELAENFGVTSGEAVNTHLRAIARMAVRNAERH